MSLTITFQKKHFLMMGLIIAIPFLILSIVNIIATAPTGQYHPASELYVDSDIDMNTHKLTNAGEITVGSTTIKGDGSISTGLNAEKLGGYAAADLMASGASIKVYNGDTCPAGYTALMYHYAEKTCTGHTVNNKPCTYSCSIQSSWLFEGLSDSHSCTYAIHDEYSICNMRTCNPDTSNIDKVLCIPNE